MRYFLIATRFSTVAIQISIVCSLSWIASPHSNDGISRYGHFTTGGMDDRIESTLPPVLSPKMVPRS